MMDAITLPWPILLPMLAAFLYSVAALGFKAATDRGASVVLVTLSANVVTAVVFLLFVPWATFVPDAKMIIDAIIPGVLFVLGQGAIVFALRKGDVSVATPLMNTKVVFVALLLFFFQGEGLSRGSVGAIVLAVIGVALLKGGAGFRKKEQGHTILFSLLSAFFFALFDVVVQSQCEVYGFGNFVPLGMIWAALLSLAASPWAGRFPVCRQGRVGLALGAGLMAAQAAAFVFTIGYFRDATNANIVYASRALWSLVVVWLFGKALGNRELEISRSEIIRRAIGAALLVAGVALALQ